MRLFWVCFTFMSCLSVSCWAAKVSDVADNTAKYAVDTYHQQVIDALAKMVSYQTFAVDGLSMEKNPHFTGFKQYIRQLSGSLGLNYEDHGYVMIITLGESTERFGIMTHGDVQPADASKWRKSPFELDSESEPGLLVARGTEDDKGPIATALYAMKAIKDKGIKLNKKIELMIYMAEESDWEHFRTFLKTYEVPPINVTIDAEYPVVTAEKGWSNIKLDMPTTKYLDDKKTAYIGDFASGSFGSQIPEDAKVVINNASKVLMNRLKTQALKHPLLTFSFVLKQKTLTITAKGKSAHSSAPEDGLNAIAFLADILATEKWPKNTASLTVAFLNELVGTGLYAEKFGDIAYGHSFMGKMSLAPTVIKASDKGINININLRRPAGKAEALLKTQSQAAMDGWAQKHGVTLVVSQLYFGDPLVVTGAPHVQPLLNIFSHFTGVANPKAVSGAGSTNAKLLPNALSFGPSMPGHAYTGHSEHEFITVEQLKLNLAMYTAMMIEL
ncbi:MAG: dipeptidase D [Phenylobacterium sp.]|jgi:dipeptidase D